MGHSPLLADIAATVESNNNIMSAIRFRSFEVFAEITESSQVIFPVSYTRHDAVDSEFWFFRLHIVISNIRKHNERIRLK